MRGIFPLAASKPLYFDTMRGITLSLCRIFSSPPSRVESQNPPNLGGFCAPYLCFDATVAYTAAWKAPSHLDSSGVKVNFWVMLVQPGDPEYDALLAEAGDCEQDTFKVSIVGHDYVNDLVNTSSLIESPVHIVNQDWLGQLAGRKFGLGDEILVNEVSGGSSINHGLGRQLLHGIHSFQVERKHDGSWA